MSGYRLTRTVRCWVEGDGGTFGSGELLEVGTVVYACRLATYGACREQACTHDLEGGYPFFDVPYDALEPERAVFDRGMAKIGDPATRMVDLEGGWLA